MAKYLLLKHYRRNSAPTNVVDIPPMETWTPDEFDAHISYMDDFADRLRETGEFVGGEALLRKGRSCAMTAPGVRRSPTARSPRPRT